MTAQDAGCIGSKSLPCVQAGITLEDILLLVLGFVKACFESRRKAMSFVAPTTFVVLLVLVSQCIVLASMR